MEVLFSHPRYSEVSESSHETDALSLQDPIHNPDLDACSVCHHILASILWESSFVAFDARPHAGSEWTLRMSKQDRI